MSRVDYDAWIESAEWQARCRRLIARRGNCCEFCGFPFEFARGRYDKATVHHLTYERLSEERDDDLAVLCWSCHSDLHAFPQIREQIETLVRRRAYAAPPEDWS